MLEEETEKLIAVFCEKEDLLPKNDRELIGFIMQNPKHNEIIP
jgi:hypothetical protein